MLLAGWVATGAGALYLGVAPLLFPLAAVATEVEDCTLTRRASVALALPGLILVAAEINGSPATLVLDTGAERSVLTAAAAKRLAVTAHYDFARPIRGIGKNIATGDAKLQGFTIGSHPFQYPRILVAGLVLPNLGGVVPDGLLGADLLADFDLDLDLPRQRLTLYDRLVCSALRPPWTGQYATIETTRSLDRHPFFPVLLDGHAIDATIDSGAQRTVLGTQVATRAGVTAAMLARDPALSTRGAGGEVLKAYAHQFREMIIGGETVRSPVVVIAGVALPRATDMVIGLDYLQSRRIWLSYGSRRIFVARHE